MPPPDKDFGYRDDLQVIEAGMRRIFLGAYALSCYLALMLILVIHKWLLVPQYLLVAISGLMLWSLSVTAYAFYTLYRFAQRTKSILMNKTFVDEMTGVFNFRYLDQRLNEEYERTRRYGGSTAVLFMDLDGFKDVNDRFGHQFGNAVLKGVAKAIRSQMRTCDVLGRAWGDEFIAVLPQTDRAQGEVVANRLREAVAAYRLEEGGRCVDFVRASIGLAAYPSNGDSVESVVSAADAAVYEAKQQGGNRVCCARGFVTTEQMGERVVRVVDEKPAQQHVAP